MKIKTPLFDIKIDILFIIVMFIFFLSDKIRVFLTSFFVCYLFIVFHEASHMLAASILGKSIDTFNISVFGVNITFKENHYSLTVKNKQYLKEILVYIAGPISNFLLAILFYKVKLVFDINVFLCFLNLIPIYPLDGYNVLENLLYFFKFKQARVSHIIKVINYCLFLILFVIGLIVLLIIYNPSLILFLLYLILIKNVNVNCINKPKYYS